LDKGVEWKAENFDTFKELRNKLAWSLGTSTGRLYSSVHGTETMQLRRLAGQMAGLALRAMENGMTLRLTFDRSVSRYPVSCEIK